MEIYVPAPFLHIKKGGGCTKKTFHASNISAKILRRKIWVTKFQTKKKFEIAAKIFYITEGSKCRLYRDIFRD
jgi:hypothetical protein